MALTIHARYGTLRCMILVMQSWKRIPPRIITNVSDVFFTEEDPQEFVWRIGQSKRFRKGIDLDVLESRYQHVYLMGEATQIFGLPNYMDLKWIVWNHFIIAGLDHHEAIRHIKRNPVK